MARPDKDAPGEELTSDEGIPDESVREEDLGISPGAVWMPCVLLLEDAPLFFLCSW